MYSQQLPVSVRLVPAEIGMSSLSPRHDSSSRHDSSHAAMIQQAIERAGELLPAQGPISAFVFLNTLQALEHLPFDEGLQRGARLFNNQPYLSEDRYRQELSQGR
ncbi:MAG: putative inorganic carbon transporter subunit DabA, partial [Planctomycetota bacterium]